MSGLEKQVSKPVLNPVDGLYYNRVRILEPDPYGGYTVVSDEPNASDNPAHLPQPWQDSIGPWDVSQLAKIAIDFNNTQLPWRCKGRVRLCGYMGENLESR
jgi:hypothetical protein